MQKQWASTWENLANAYENSDGKDWLIGQRIQDYQRGSLCLTDRFSRDIAQYAKKSITLWYNTLRPDIKSNNNIRVYVQIGAYSNVSKPNV